MNQGVSDAQNFYDALARDGGAGTIRLMGTEDEKVDFESIWRYLEVARMEETLSEDELRPLEND